jgi:hypothetical protein
MLLYSVNDAAGGMGIRGCKARLDDVVEWVLRVLSFENLSSLYGRLHEDAEPPTAPPSSLLVPEVTAAKERWGVIVLRHVVTSAAPSARMDVEAFMLSFHKVQEMNL